MTERVSGFCITWDSDRLPNLDSCEVDRVSEQRFLLPLGDEEEELVGHISLKFGEDFFYERLSALVRFVHLLDEEIDRLMDVVVGMVKDKAAAEKEIDQLRAEAEGELPDAEEERD